MELAGLADSPVAAGDQVRKARADVILLGWPASSPHSQRLFNLIQESRTVIRVIMLTSEEKQEDFFEAVKQGCCGLLPKKASTELLIKSIRKVYAGEFWLDRMTTADVIRKLAKKFGREQLTARNPRAERRPQPARAGDRGPGGAGLQE